MHQLVRANYGSPSHLRRIAGLQVSTTAYAGDTALPMHEHADPYLCLVAGGGYAQNASGRSSDFREGMLLVHPEGHRHANRFSARGARCLSVYLSPELAATPALTRLLGDHRQLRLRGAPALLSRIDRELTQTDDAADLALHAAVLELIALACRRTEAPVRRPPWLDLVLDRLHDDPTLTPALAELAALADVDPTHLARIFRATQGVTIGDYLRGLRVELASTALRGSRRPIAEIALDAGFADQSHFARVFKARTGQSPRHFRQRA
jgi:AraC family transcriptional regulator